MAGTTLKADKIAQTARLLSSRIEERFPESGLFSVSCELVDMGEAARVQVPILGKPNYALRALVGLLILIIIAIVVSLVLAAIAEIDQLTRANLVDLLTAIESGTNEIFLIGLAILFLVSLETRIDRSRILHVLHELRSLAHVIDMHQLTKDPGYFRTPLEMTKSSPKRTLSLTEMIRYLDYCSELLSITSKIAALYAQEMNDRVVLSAVSDIEGLVTGLSQKIWQKSNIAGEIQNQR